MPEEIGIVILVLLVLPSVFLFALLIAFIVGFFRIVKDVREIKTIMNASEPKTQPIIKQSNQRIVNPEVDLSGNDSVDDPSKLDEMIEKVKSRNQPNN